MADRMEVETKVVVTGGKRSGSKERLNDLKEMKTNVKTIDGYAGNIKKSFADAFSKTAIIGWAKIIKDTVNYYHFLYSKCNN